MEKTIGQRISEVRIRRGMKPAELARRAGIPRQTLHSIERPGGTANPGLDVLKPIAKALDVSVAFLQGLTDREDGFPERGDSDDLAQAIAAQVTKTIRDLLDTDSRLRRVFPIAHDQQRIPAGGAAPMDEVYTDLPGDTSRLVALTVRGHCMEPDIRDGETVIIDTERPAELKDVVAVYLEGDWTLKRLRRRNGIWLLVPDNTDYQPIEIDPTKVRVLGVVVQVSRGKP